MIYLVAVKYKKADNLTYNTEIFEFKSKKTRLKFVDEIQKTKRFRDITDGIAFSRIEDDVI